MKYGQQRDGSGSAILVRHVVPGEWSNFLLICKTVRSFADVRERADIVCRKLVVHDEPSQRVALPSRTVLRPFEYFLQDRHCFSIEITRDSGQPGLSVLTEIRLLRTGRPDDATGVL